MLSSRPSYWYMPNTSTKATEQVNAIGGFPDPPRQRYDPFSNTYNEGWRDHPNFRYGNQQQDFATQ